MKSLLLCHSTNGLILQQAVVWREYIFPHLTVFQGNIINEYQVARATEGQVLRHVLYRTEETHAVRGNTFQQQVLMPASLSLKTLEVDGKTHDILSASDAKHGNGYAAISPAKTNTESEKKLMQLCASLAPIPKKVIYASDALYNHWLSWCQRLVPETIKSVSIHIH